MKIKFMTAMAFVFVASISSDAICSTEETIVRDCTKAAGVEQNNYEKKYIQTMNNGKKVKSEDFEVISPTTKMNQIKMFSNACIFAFRASNNGIEKSTYSDYLLEQIYTKTGISEVDYSWFKPVFIKMVDAGYNLSEEK
ncbi:hypothetical protein [Atlantibacter hermannii]|uniref:hypothetical protein n=1 Tax=Atlantibacter hermannii TaxID=565 RepID=UPI003329D9BD